MSAGTAAARKPGGAVTEPLTERNGCFISKQSSSFVEAAQEVHALHGLTGGALGEVVLGAEDEETARARVEAPGDLNEVGGLDVLGVGQCVAFEQPHERLFPVGVRVALADGRPERRVVGLVLQVP